MRGHEKSIQRRRLPKKGGLKTVCQFKGGGGLGKKKVVVFLRQRWNFSSKAIGKIIAEVEAKKHYLPQQCLGNFFADIIE